MMSPTPRPPSPMEGSTSARVAPSTRSEEHTSELQSPYDIVCRLLLEKKKIASHPIPRHLLCHTTLLPLARHLAPKPSPLHVARTILQSIRGQHAMTCRRSYPLSHDSC